MAYVGEERFVEGLRAYFRDHAWGNTTLDDLMRAIGAAAGRDLAAWQAGWLDRAGTDTIVLMPDPGGPLGVRKLLTTSPDGGEPRRHHLRIGSYRRTPDGDPGAAPVELVASTDVETTGTTTAVDLPDADLHLLNDGDLTFAAVRTDEASLEAMLVAGPAPAGRVSRAGAVTTAWDMLAKGELSAGDFLDCVLGRAGDRAGARARRAVLRLALQAAERWSPTVLVPRRLARVADVAARRAGGDRPPRRGPQHPGRAATAPEHFELLDRESESNVDLAWRVLIRRASLGRYDEEAVAARCSTATPTRTPRSGPTPSGGVRPTAEAKEEAWSPGLRGARRAAGPPLGEVGRRFWRPVQHHLLVPWADRYLEVVTALHGEGMLATLSLVKTHGAGHRATTTGRTGPGTAADGEGVDPLVRNVCSPPPTRSPGCSRPGLALAVLDGLVLDRGLLDLDREAQLLLPLDRGADQAREQRVRSGRPGPQLGVRLRGDVVGVHVAGQLHELDEVVVRRGPREHEAGLLELVAVDVVDLVAVPVPLLDQVLAVGRPRPPSPALSAAG